MFYQNYNQYYIVTYDIDYNNIKLYKAFDK